MKETNPCKRREISDKKKVMDPITHFKCKKVGHHAKDCIVKIEDKDRRRQRSEE
jgi:hypothetical protein